MIDYEATPGIRTRYKGINFRSRLEAKYAVLFDILEWKWHCEPIDLKGWIPDFAIVGRKKPIYVEVKPIWKIMAAEPIKRKIEKALFFDMPDTDDNRLRIRARLRSIDLRRRASGSWTGYRVAMGLGLGYGARD